MGRLTPPLRTEPLTDDFGLFTIRWAEFFEESAAEINSSSENTDVLSNINYSAAHLSTINKRIHDLELLLNLSSLNILTGFQKILPIKIVTSDYISAGSQVIVVNSTSLVTITLNPNTNKKELVQVVRFGSGGVKVTATKKINGQTIKTILRRYTSPRHLFIPEVDSWNTI